VTGLCGLAWLLAKAQLPQKAGNKNVRTDQTWPADHDKVRNIASGAYSMILSFRQPDGSGKQKDSFRRQHETWRRAYAEALSLRERFPKVEQLVLEMTFTDLTQLGTYSSQMRSFSAPAKAFFAIPCPRTLCLDGGFDLDALIATMLARGEAETAGTMECQGWTNPARPDHARCGLQMHYRVEAHYHPVKSSPSGRRTRGRPA